MGHAYELVLWNKYKKSYDKILVLGMVVYLVLFAVVTVVLNSETTVETLILRAFGSLAIIMLHIILVIGPLCRLDSRFLPILYNRRHLGVSTFIAALVHGIFAIVQFHTLGKVNAIYSIFTSNMDYGSLTNFPFQVLGFLALLMLFVMAATSHDFFLANLSAKVWKRLHMMVYVAYALIISHVFLGAFQQETSPFTIGIFILGFVIVAGVHLTTAFRESKIDNAKATAVEGWLEVCTSAEIEEDRAIIFTVGNERVAIFKYDGKLSAIHNVCKHQGGPLGEGKIINGCITCPWHGFQYLPHNGQSPPPFTEKVMTYQLKVIDDTVFIHQEAFTEGTEVEPCIY